MKQALLLDQGLMGEDLELVLAHGDDENEVIALQGSIRFLRCSIV